MAKNPLPLRNTTYDLSVSTELKIEDLEHIFDRDAYMVSDTFGQDWRISVRVIRKPTNEDDGEEQTISTFFHVGFLLKPMKLRVTFTLRSVAGISDKTNTFEHEIDSMEMRGYPKFVTKAYLFHQTRPFKRDNACILGVTVQSKELFRPANNLEGIIRPASKIALARSLVMPSIVDTRFLLFNNRVRGVVRPKHVKSVYANSQMLRSANPYFESMLPTENSSGFRESVIHPNIFNTTKEMPSFETAFDYDSDSDLEENEEEDEDDEEDDDEYEEDDAPKMDISAEDGQDNGASRILSEDPTDSANISQVPVFEGRREGYIITVPDTAYNTWLAMIYYLQTGEIRFSPLISTGDEPRRKIKEEWNRTRPHFPAPVSSKSIIRLADKLGLTDLEEIALEYHSRQLTLKNAPQEVFSKFTSRYDKVRAIQMQFILKNWGEISLSEPFQEKMKQVFSGTLPHGGIIIAELLTHVRSPSKVDS